MRSGTSLLIIDNAERLQDPLTQMPSVGLRKVVEGALAGGAGRVLLLTNHAPADGMWLEGCRRKILRPPGADDAQRLLDALLRDRGKEHEIPPQQRTDVVRWLGANPRALRALVACLGEEPLESLIELEPDAWELRDEVVSPALIQKLETYFLTRTLDQLDSNALVLLEMLSIYRKPFRGAAIERLSNVVANVSLARSRLASRYLIDVDRNYYTLHPIIRRLARKRIAEDPKREQNAHRAAADHFSRSLRRPTGPAKLHLVGETFVEARYHLLAAGRDSDFEALASDYRRELLAQYRSPTAMPADETSRRHLLSTLQGALGASDDGYSALRVLLARLLLDRGQHDGDRLALRQLTLASRDSKDPYCWKARLELTLKFEGNTAGRAVAEQALSALNPANARYPVLGYAAGLIRANDPVLDTQALDWLDRHRDSVPRDSSYGLFTAAAFVLSRNRRRPEAVDVLLVGHEHVGGQDPNAWRLLEEAAFIAAATRDQDGLARVRAKALTDRRESDLVTLCDVLTLQSAGRWSEVSAAVGNCRSLSVVAQSAFSLLCSGDPGGATTLLTQQDVGQNRTGAWLRALVALCAGRPDIYAAEIQTCVSARLGPAQSPDPALWLSVWDEVPHGVENFPAFYFPRLPQSLTGLDFDLVRLPEDGSATSAVDHELLRLPTVQDSKSFDDAIECSDDYTTMPSLITVNGDLIMSKDIYNVAGQAGAVGRGASAPGATFNQVVSQMNAAQLMELTTELSRLREAMREAATTPEEDMAVAEVARAEVAARNGDTDDCERALSRAGGWAWKTANAIGTSLAAGALKAALGL